MGHREHLKTQRSQGARTWTPRTANVVCSGGEGGRSGGGISSSAAGFANWLAILGVARYAFKDAC